MSRTLRTTVRVSGWLIALGLVGCGDGGLSCGAGTSAVGAVCVVVDAGVAPSADAATAVDAARDRVDAAPAMDAGSDAFASIDAGTDAWRSTIDAGHDAWIADAGPIDLRDGDTLTMRPSTATLVPGYAVCPELTVLHMDGTTTAVGLGEAIVTVTPFDATIVEATAPGDCTSLPGAVEAPGVGILSLAPGTTTAQFTVSSMGHSVSATLAIDVEDGTLTIDTDPGVVVPVGGSADESFTVTPHTSSGGYVDLSAYARILPRLFSGLTGMPTGVFDIGPGPVYYVHEVTGVAVGTAHIQGTYGVPGYTTSFTSSQLVTVVAPGTLRAIARIDYDSLAGSLASDGPPTSMAPGDCLVMHTEGTFQNSDGASYVQLLGSAVTYTATGAGHVDGAEVCATGRGEIAVQVCDASVCATDHIPVLTPDMVTSFTVTPSGVTLTGTTLSPSGCVALQAVLQFTDGTTQDVTNSYATRWPATAAGFVTVFREPDGGGAPPMVDASGHPCYGVLGTTGGHGSLPVRAYYGNIQSNVVTFSW